MVGSDYRDKSVISRRVWVKGVGDGCQEVRVTCLKKSEERERDRERETGRKKEDTKRERERETERQRQR